jgi:hypothetical protein
MVRLRNGLAALAALGLVAATPVSAATRAAQALPAPAAQLDPTRLDRASQPLGEAEAMRGEGLSPGILVALVAVILAILLAASGGGGGGPDSPG